MRFLGRFFRDSGARRRAGEGTRVVLTGRNPPGAAPLNKKKDTKTPCNTGSLGRFLACIAWMLGRGALAQDLTRPGPKARRINGWGRPRTSFINGGGFLTGGGVY